MNFLNGYDPVTLNHWLWYKYKCHEGSANEFQKLFEDILKRAEPEFMQIRPYGNIGDRKCDGLFFSEPNRTIFQVYSPDELKQAEVQDKINEDLDGAVKHWGDTLKKWVFVYNVRRGLPPDIPKTLDEKKKQYPNIHLDHLSSDGLWEKARKLTVQQRSEILGAPSGYEHLFFTSSPTSSELKEILDKSWFVLIQDELMTIDINSVEQALSPDLSFGYPTIIRPKLGRLPWTEAAEYQKQIFNEVIAKSKDISLSRFAVFSLTPIPLVVHLGFLLSDGRQVRYHQYDRDRYSWQWPEVEENEIDCQIKVTGLLEQYTENPNEILIRVSLSAKIHKQQTDSSISNIPIPMEIDVFVENPHPTWLVSPKQLNKLAKEFRKVLSNIRNHVPNCPKIHLFCAAPTGACIVMGQAINPRMNPPIALYEFKRQSEPPYKWALTLTDENT
jgi:hypothetical protein